VFAILLFATIGLFAYRATPRRRRLASVSAAGLILYSWLPVALAAARIWERGYPPLVSNGSDAGAIVVLSGGVHRPFPPLNEPVLGEETYERCLSAAQVHRQWSHLPLLASGGSPVPGLAPFSEAMRSELLRHGVPVDLIWTETRSRSTYENAVYTTELLRLQRISTIVLVTSASHMRRAVGTFRKQGLQVRPAPCDLHFPDRLRPRDFLWPNWRAASLNDELMHELLGIVWYRLRARI
jgi:uncharacterized SAM-binding protein YcdF (DUF218 family)